MLVSTSQHAKFLSHKIMSFAISLNPVVKEDTLDTLKDTEITLTVAILDFNIPKRYQTTNVCGLVLLRDIKTPKRYDNHPVTFIWKCPSPRYTLLICINTAPLYCLYTLPIPSLRQIIIHLKTCSNQPITRGPLGHVVLR